MVFWFHFDQPLPCAQRKQPIHLAYCGFEGPVCISSKHLDFSLGVTGTQKLQIINIVDFEKFSQILVLLHSDCSQLFPHLASGIAIVEAVEVVAGPVAEHAHNLVQFGRGQTREEENEHCSNEEH